MQQLLKGWGTLQRAYSSPRVSSTCNFSAADVSCLHECESVLCLSSSTGILTVQQSERPATNATCMVW